MKRLSLIAVLLFLAALSGCGSATEVGNPTGEVPRTITGMIDVATIPDLAASAVKAQAYEPDDLNVYALATDGTSVEAPVGVTGSFSMEVFVGGTYSFSVRLGAEAVGDFSFEIDSQGGRGNRLEIAEAGDPIDLGTCRYEDGGFRPEREPLAYQGVRGASQGEGGDGNGGHNGNGS